MREGQTDRQIEKKIDNDDYKKITTWDRKA
jgi:hypothetical protein